MKGFLWVAILAVVLPGCASLTIDVDMYQGETSQELSRLQIRNFTDSLLKEAVLYPDRRRDAFESFLGEARSLVIAEIVESRLSSGVSEKCARENANEIWDDPETGLQGVLEGSWASVAPLGDEVREAVLNLRTRSEVTSGESVQNEYRSVLKELSVFSAALDAYRRAVREALSDKASSSVPRILTVLSEYLRPDPGIVSSAAGGRTVGHPIFDSELSRLSRSEKNWKDFSFLRKSAHGGSSQMVVVQQGLVVFQPKSLDFDPTPVIGAATAVTRLGLEVAATMASGRFASLSNPEKTSCTEGESGCDNPLKTQKLVEEGKIEAHRLTLERRASAKKNLLLDLADLSERAAEGSADEATIKDLKSSLQKIVGRYSARTGASTQKESKGDAPKKEEGEEEPTPAT